MKKCESCDKYFDIITSGSGGHNRNYCYNCFPNGLTKSERSNLRISLLRKKSEEYKINKGCIVCGYNKAGLALEWHHLEDDKLDNPSNLLSISWTAYINETKKCVLLCSNCHREVHSGITKL